MNVLGSKLTPCDFNYKQNNRTGYFRTGFCTTDNSDKGTHTVCDVVTNEFLQFTLQKGNDLITPSSYFPGLKQGDTWCLCALRWLEAYKAGVAPPILASSTNIKTLSIIPFDILKPFFLINKEHFYY